MDDNLGETETTVGETIADPSLADVTDLMQDVRLQDLMENLVNGLDQVETPRVTFSGLSLELCSMKSGK